MKRVLAASLILAAGVGGAWAQTKPVQKVTPPETRYWVGATSGSGMMAMMGAASAMGDRPSMGDVMGMMSGGMRTDGRMLELRIGSSLAPTGTAEASHTMPAAAQVNKPIWLTPPPKGKGDSEAGTYQIPKGRITFYWGCGEKAGPGQPIVLDFQKLSRGEVPDGELGGIDVNEVRKPTTGNSRTYASWPNGDRRNNGLKVSFPPGASLAGAHTIAGNFAPEIAFTAAKNFMEPVRYTGTQLLPSGALAVSWGGVPRATGYSLGVMAPEKLGDDSANLVMWSSSAQSGTFILMEDIAPAEAARLVKAKAILPPSQTSCTVPAEVVKATKEGSMLMFTAFGDQETFIHPPRPSDPKVTWDQEWFARISHKSARMDMLSPQGVMDMSSAMSAGRGPGAGGRDPSQMSDAEYCAMREAQRPPSAAEALGAATGIPGGGMLGRALGGRKKQEEKDPRCP